MQLTPKPLHDDTRMTWHLAFQMAKSMIPESVGSVIEIVQNLEAEHSITLNPKRADRNMLQKQVV